VKPEFDKEFTFSKVLARRDGQELFISEVQEKTLHRDALGRLWNAHAAQARETARREWYADRALASPPASAPSGCEPAA
jgi:hypothetical protein